jgi:hypothetical protein
VEIPLEVESQLPLAGLLVELEVSGGSAVPALAADAGGFVLDWVAKGPGRFVATIRRDATGENLAPGKRVPLVARVSPSGSGEVTASLLRAEAVGEDLTLVPVHLAEAEALLVPSRLTLLVPFDLPVASQVRLEIWDVSGRLVRRLIDERLPAGFHTTRWDGRDARGLEVASGIYLYTLRAAGQTVTRKMTMLR